MRKTESCACGKTTAASGPPAGHARTDHFRFCERPPAVYRRKPVCRRQLGIIMASARKAVAAAAVLNTGIFVVEGIAGFQASSLSLIMDAIHNFSDQVAIVFLYLAFVLSQGVSRNLMRSANFFNTVGLVAIAGVLLWSAVERLFDPAPVIGTVAIMTGLAASAANWGVAQFLKPHCKNNAAIRLAYVHNLGDVWVSLAPVAAGLLVIVTGYPIFDPIVAAIIAIWFISTTLWEVIGSHEELIWPEKLVDTDEEQTPTARG